MTIDQKIHTANQARNGVLALESDFAGLSLEGRDALESALRIGRIPSSDIADAKRALRAAKAALSEFWRSIGGMDPNSQALIARATGLSFVARNSAKLETPKKLVKIERQIYELYRSLAKEPSVIHAHETLPLLDKLGVGITDSQRRTFRSGTVGEIRALAENGMARSTSKARVLEAAMALSQAVCRAEWSATRLGTNMDMVVWSSRAVYAAMCIAAVIV